MTSGKEPKYPSHLDVAWVAVDGRGRIGVFTTGGEGPIPTIYLRDGALLDWVTSAMGALPVVSGVDLFTDVPRPDDFVGFARRGLYSFDWTDVHRTRNLTDVYEIQARPLAPVTVTTAGLPTDLLDVLAGVTSHALDFDAVKIDVVKALECAVQPADAAAGASPRR